MSPRLVTTALMLVGAGCAAAAARTVPAPLPDHRGHVWLAGETVELSAPADAARWVVVDIAGRTVAEGTPTGRVVLGQPAVGYYELRGLAADGAVRSRSGLAVLNRLVAPTPEDSPISIDVATAWFYQRDQLELIANQCALAGVNWVRDRLTWGAVETQRGQLAEHTLYDDTAAVMTAAGLKSLQVFHGSPAWTGQTDGRRMAPDLRDVYNFQKAFAARWKGQVLAWEPWNEAEIDGFGGHTGLEMASWQKAAYWGLRAGSPEALVCHNVFAHWRTDTMADVFANESFAYCDTFNFHHYSPIDSLADTYRRFASVSGGRPLWVSEAGTHPRWTGDDKEKEPTEPELQRQAQFVTQCYATSIAEGSVATFFFVFPNYAEGDIQFGLTRRDLSPRPGYVAMAAAGRLLAGAKPLGRVPSETRGDLRLCAFDARPDGQPKTVVVAWSAGAPVDLPNWAHARVAFDHFGRSIEPPARVGADPVYLLLDPGAELKVTRRAPEPRALVVPSPLVLQPMPPAEKRVVDRSATAIEPGTTQPLPVFAYNFSAKPITTTVSVACDAGLTVKPAQLPLTVAPGERVELRFEAAVSAEPQDVGRLTARFEATADTTRAVAVAGYLVPLSALKPRARLAVPGAAEAANWRTMNSPGKMTIEPAEGADGGVLVTATLDGPTRRRCGSRT
ncbi:MAG: hypothetical protein HZB16_13775 [Armatimonadetes bacterium]|nr:hypothetical protein [Armatimonadota bacterium]